MDRLELTDAEAILLNRVGLPPRETEAPKEAVSEQPKAPEAASETKAPEVKVEEKQKAQENTKTDETASRKKVLAEELDALEGIDGEKVNALRQHKQKALKEIETSEQVVARQVTDEQAINGLTSKLKPEDQEALTPFLVDAIENNLLLLKDLTPQERALRLLKIAKESQALLGSPKQESKEELRRQVGSLNANQPSNADSTSSVDQRIYSSDPSTSRAAINEAIFEHFKEQASPEAKRMYGLGE